MRVLAVTNMYPTDERPFVGTFIHQQVAGLRQIGVEVDVLHFDRVGRGVGVYRTVTDRVQAAVDAARPDVMHVMYGGILARRAVRAIRRLRPEVSIPTLVSFCGSDLLGEPDAGMGRRFVAGLGIRASHQAARECESIIVKSANLRESLPDGVPRAPVHVLPNGVDLERFKPQDRDACREALDWRNDQFHIVFPATGGAPVKRPALARAAVAAAVDLGVPAVLQRLGGVPHAEVPCWLNAAHVVLLTSRHEGSPNVIKEALACNTPVVSVNVGDVRERTAGITGCHIVNADVDSLGRALKAVFDRGGPVRSRPHVEDLSTTRIAERLRAIYRELRTAARSGRLRR